MSDEMAIDVTQEFPIRPYNDIALAKMYEVHRKTFARWLKPFRDQIGKRQGYYYSVKQVELIFQKLGMPGTSLLDLV